MGAKLFPNLGKFTINFNISVDNTEYETTRNKLFAEDVVVSFVSLENIHNSIIVFTGSR